MTTIILMANIACLLWPDIVLFTLCVLLYLVFTMAKGATIISILQKNLRLREFYKLFNLMYNCNSFHVHVYGHIISPSPKYKTAVNLMNLGSK